MHPNAVSCRNCTPRVPKRQFTVASCRPVQGRLIELFDNHDGTLSIFGTLIDTKAPPAVAPDGVAGTDLSRQDLAALHRAMAYNDPQNGNGEPNAARGKRRDRNVELLIDDPR